MREQDKGSSCDLLYLIEIRTYILKLLFLVSVGGDIIFDTLYDRLSSK